VQLYRWQQSMNAVHAPAHFSRAVGDVLSNTRHDRPGGRAGHTAWPPRSTPDVNPLHFYLWRHLNTLMYAAPVDNIHRDTSPSHCGCLSDYPQLPRHLSTDAAAHDEACREVHWISWRTYYKCTLSAITHKLNVSGNILLWYEKPVLKACPQRSVTHCTTIVSKFVDWPQSVIAVHYSG
jgi:hypothetical protein